jgi:hypothetical protein
MFLRVRRGVRSVRRVGLLMDSYFGSLGLSSSSEYVLEDALEELQERLEKEKNMTVEERR